MLVADQGSKLFACTVFSMKYGKYISGQVPLSLMVVEIILRGSSIIVSE